MSSAGIGLSLRSILCLLAIVVFVGCTVFLLQGMLPGVGLLSDEPISKLNVDEGTAALRRQHRHRSPSINTSPLIINDHDVVDITNVDLLAKLLPPHLQSSSKNVQVQTKRIKILGLETFYREAFPPFGVNGTGQNALLLHGMHFTSKTWLDLGTVNLLAALGCRVVAIDLPGYGESIGQIKVPIGKRSDYLDNLMTTLKLDTNSIVISPSMSGSFSLQFLIENPGRMAGLVTVSPVASDKFTAEQYATVKTPTLIVYGDADEPLGKLSTANLKQIANSQVRVLPKSKHAAYLDQPELFHRLLYNFFTVLSPSNTDW